MRFEGLLSDEALIPIVERIDDGEDWVYEDTVEKVKEYIKGAEAKVRLREIYVMIKRWKDTFGTLSRGTVFIFVHEPEDPKAFKIYDTSSLGCGTSLPPPRWKIYLKELEGKV